MKRPVLVVTAITTLLVSSALAAPKHGNAKKAPKAGKVSREIVLVDEHLALCGERLPGYVDDFVRRVERVAGFPKGSWRGKAFVDPAAGLAYVREHRAAVAWLPLREYLQSRDHDKLEAIATTMTLDMHDVIDRVFVGIAKKKTAVADPIQSHPRGQLRLAVGGGDDAHWLNVLFDGTLVPDVHFRIIPGVKDDKDAFARLEKGEADVALVSDRLQRQLKDRLTAGGDLKVVYETPFASGSPIAVHGAAASSPERRKLEAAIPQLCAGEAIGVCSHLGILAIFPLARSQKERARVDAWTYRWEHYRM